MRPDLARSKALFELNTISPTAANKALDNESGGSESHAPVQINYLTDRLRSDEVPTTIYLIRHGETPMTPERRFSGSGPNDPGLSDDGLAQAAAVATVIEEIKPDVLIASPMKRAQQTAQAIAQSTHLQIINDEIWTELSFGHWDGLTNQEVRAQFPDEYEAWLSSTAFAPKDGESHNSIAARVEAGLSHLVDTYPGKKVVVVTHNMVIRHAVRITIGAPIEGAFHIDIKPASLTSMTIWPSDGLRCLHMVGNDSHVL